MSAIDHEFSIKLPAPPDRVFRALTEPGELKAWFAEHAEVEAREGGAFRFWGRHTYGQPTRSDASQTLIAFDDPRRLAFSWRVDGVASEVALMLEPETADDGAAGTHLKGRHSFSSPLKIGRASELVDDLWKLHCGNLKSHLEGGDEITLPDFADPEPKIEASIIIDAPREAVWKALVTPEILAKWMWAENAVVEPRVGGRYSYGWKYSCAGADVEGGPTQILEMVENEKLVTDWPDWRGDKAVPVQRVTWLLEEIDGKTRVTVIHDGFTRAADFSDYPFGWSGFLGQLKGVFDAKD